MAGGRHAVSKLCVVLFAAGGTLTVSPWSVLDGLALLEGPGSQSSDSLVVRDAETLEAASVTLERTLAQLVSTCPTASRPGAAALFRQIWGAGSGARLESGWPASVPLDGSEAKGTDEEIGARIRAYVPIALEGAFHESCDTQGSCGELRIVYGRSAGERRIIFEVPLTCPTETTAQSCRSTTAPWRALSLETVGGPRARGLERLLYGGQDGLQPGILDHVRPSRGGSGRIRTVQRAGGAWVETELGILTDPSSPCPFRLVPTAVRVRQP